MMLIKHTESTIQIRNNQINNFLIFARVTVNDSRVVIVLIFDRFLHGSQCEFLIFIISVTPNLNSH